MTGVAGSGKSSLINDVFVGQHPAAIVIEHNLDVIKIADWIIDLGPEGGSHGGQIVFEGTPAQLLKADTYTAKYLRASA